MPRRFVGFALMVALVVPNIPMFAAPSPGAETAATGEISGTAAHAGGQKIANTTVTAREMRTARLAGTTMSDASGQFTFTGLNPGTYVVEVVNAAGRVVGTSGAIALTPVAMTATGLTVIGVTSTAAAARGGSFFATTAGILMLAASGAGVMGVVVATNTTDASPSR